jgi:hypothetical protein
VVRGELFGSIGGAVEETKRRGNEGRHFAVRETEEETLFFGPAIAWRVVLFDVGEDFGLRL